jgi:hypothetical protein
MKAKAPSDYEKFVLEQQDEILTNPITALANDIPDNLFRTAFYSKIKSSSGDKQIFYINFASAFYRLLIQQLTTILVDEYDTSLYGLARDVYFTEAKMGSSIADDRSEKFAVFQIIQRVMLHLADVMRHQLSVRDKQTSDEIAKVVEMYSRALRLRCTHGS